jgi:hypothetical protein
VIPLCRSLHNPAVRPRGAGSTVNVSEVTAGSQAPSLSRWMLRSLKTLKKLQKLWFVTKTFRKVTCCYDGDNNTTLVVVPIDVRKNILCEVTVVVSIDVREKTGFRNSLFHSAMNSSKELMIVTVGIGALRRRWRGAKPLIIVVAR